MTQKELFARIKETHIKMKKEEARTKDWPRKPAYESDECKAVGLMATCNFCDRVIWADENWMEEYAENGGYCKECVTGENGAEYEPGRDG